MPDPGVFICCLGLENCKLRGVREAKWEEVCYNHEASKPEAKFLET